MLMNALTFVEQHSALATVFLTLAMVVLTLCYVVTTIAIMRKQERANGLSEQAINTARLVEKRGRRPLVLFDLESRDSFTLYAVLRNLGAQPALDVSVTIDPPLYRSNSALRPNLSFVAHPISSMVPGREIGDYVGQLREHLGGTRSTDHRVTLSYRDSDGIIYQETSVVSTEYYRDLMVCRNESAEERIAKGITAMERSLRDLSETLIRLLWTVDNIANRPARDTSALPEAGAEPNTFALSSDELEYLREIASPGNWQYVPSGLLAESHGDEMEQYHQMLNKFLTCGLMRKQADRLVLTGRAYRVLRAPDSDLAPSCTEDSPEDPDSRIANSP